MKSLSSKYKYLVGNTALFAISSFGSKLLSFFLVPLYTNILSTADYGMADLISTTNSVLSYLLTICIADAVVRFVMERAEEQQAIFAFGFKIILRGGLILAAAVLAAWYWKLFNWPEYCYVFLFAEYLTGGCNNVTMSYLRGRDQVRDVAIAGILTTLSYLTLTILFLVHFRWGIVGYLSAICVGNLVSCVYGLLRTGFSDGQTLRTPLQKETKKEMVHYSFPLVLNGLSWWVNSSLDRYFIVSMCGAAHNGLYAAAGKIPGLLSLVQTVFGQALTLSAFKHGEKDDADGFLSQIYTYYSMGLLLGCSALVLINIPLASFLFSKEFFAAWQYVPILLVSSVFSGMSSVLSATLSAGKRTDILAKTTMLSAIVNTGLNALLIPWLDVFGAATATAISFMVMWLVRFLTAKKIGGLRVSLMREFAGYLLLVVQILAALTETHLYPVQLGAFVALLLLRGREMRFLFSVLARILKKSRNEN